MVNSLTAEPATWRNEVFLDRKVNFFNFLGFFGEGGNPFKINITTGLYEVLDRLLIMTIFYLYGLD